MIIHLGLDSTDSPTGGCTTYTASKIIDAIHLIEPNIIFSGFPKLIRLNPNIPIKTRGNASISFTIETTMNPNIIFEIAKKIVIADKEANDGEPNKQPGLVLKTGDSISHEIYSRGLQEVIQLHDYSISDLTDFYYPKDANGLIGALCAIYSDLSQDHTYELIVYRKKSSLGTERKLNINNIISADRTFSSTFSSFDHTNRRELIAPSGPDPVFCGIRSNNTDELIPFFNSLNIHEQIDSWTIFKSNQATNCHVTNPITIISPYHVFSGELTIVVKAEELRGGHVKLVTLTEDKQITCMVFEPTKELRDIARLLIPGDKIYAHGNIKGNKLGRSMSLEFFTILHLAEDIKRSPPKCSCGTNTKSAGRLKGYKCPDCKTVILIPQIVRKKRSPELFINQQVYAAESAQRHLTKPKSRLHRFNKNIEDLLFTYDDIRNKL